MRGVKNTDIRACLEQKTVKTNGCWEWVGNKDKNGYGRLSVNCKQKRTHRLAYELYVGKIPEGMLVCHHCDNPPCVNPKHLFVGTSKDNMHDRDRKGRAADRRGERCSTSKLTWSDVRDIREIGKTSLSHRKIARLFGVRGSTVGHILLGKTWKTTGG